VVWPALRGVTASCLTSPQLVNSTEEALTVATEASLLSTAATSLVLPVRLQPLFPSSFVLSATKKLTLPLTPLPAVRFTVSAVASTESSRLLEITSANAIAGNASTSANATKSRESLLVNLILIFDSPLFVVFPANPLSIPSHFSLEAQFLL
ncbi:MAG: hypothetical protein AVDCRST_MAG01-01-1773, partial [uncultured Rubrobacteraceae bacterium]